LTKPSVTVIIGRHNTEVVTYYNYNDEINILVNQPIMIY